MTPERSLFLPGVPVDYVTDRLSRAGGKELEGKFASPESSAALAVNSFGWFHARPLPSRRFRG